jgi:cytochrome c-type biogenesis protein CcmH/NrfG
MLDRTARFLRKLTRLFYKAMDLGHHAAHPAQTTEKKDITQTREFKVNELIHLADRQRDSGDFPAAAATYIQILDLAPHRTDIRVQAGNMLKDSGHLTEAEALYRHAAREAPTNADVFLQLGHVLKLAGRRSLRCRSIRI